MKKVVLDIPTLWADHHVLKVRDALVNLEGVEEVFASSGWKQVLVTYNGTRTSQATMEKVLAEAGYPVGEGEMPVLALPGTKLRDPQWQGMSLRMTETNMVDLEMSGEFRRY
jgi:copper chaperone CopZ